MSDAIPLPPRPNLEQYKKLAKDLQHAAKSGAIREWAARFAETTEAERLNFRWQKFQKINAGAARCTLSAAQFFLARSHGFPSWPKFSHHLEELALTQSPISQFETAVDAIVAGDIATLTRLLKENPDLVHSRSTREHRSTLLHYVSANGVEDFRQKTPKNIVEIASLLLKANADVNAESDAYGGRSTTLGLTATSVHPEKAGVQLDLMQLLIDHGALIDGPDGGSAVTGCLHNGRGGAARFLADRGARLDLEGAAGVGRLDVVQSYFQEDGKLMPPAIERLMLDGFAWACEFGHTNVVDFLLQKGIDPVTKLKHHGNTGLHWAAYGGHPDTVRLLLQRRAPIDAVDDSFDGTPLEWALHAWGESKNKDSYYEVVALLARAGSKLNWSHQERQEERIRSDQRMMAALNGEMPGE